MSKIPDTDLEPCQTKVGESGRIAQKEATRSAVMDDDGISSYGSMNLKSNFRALSAAINVFSDQCENSTMVGEFCYTHGHFERTSFQPG